MTATPRERMEKDEFRLLFDRALTLCGARPDNEGWTEQREEWWAWFCNYDAKLLRAGFPLMLKSLDPERNERLPTFTRMRAVMDALNAREKAVARGNTCDLCRGTGSVQIRRVDGGWMLREQAEEAGIQGIGNKTMRCVCGDSARVNDSVPCVARHFPLQVPASRAWKAGALTRIVADCMKAGREGATRKELEDIADRHIERIRRKEARR